MERSNQVSTLSLVQLEGAFAEVRGWCVLPQKDKTCTTQEAQNSS